MEIAPRNILKEQASPTSTPSSWLYQQTRHLFSSFLFAPTSFLRKNFTAAVALVLSLSLGCQLSGCGNGSEEMSGPAFSRPPVAESPLDSNNLTGGIDTTHLAEGYVGFSAKSSSRLKVQVAINDIVQNYDLPNDGSAIVCPISRGDGSYTFKIMENASDNRYFQIEVNSSSVQLADEFQPFLRPNIYCAYTPTSACVQKANELTAGVENQAEALSNIYTWIVDNIKYDRQKAATVTPGYTPNPDATLQSKTGICFDYASLAAAMLRSQGIPCKIVTGNVAPSNIFHAWNMVYINGSWKTVRIHIKANTWARIDTTFAAGGDVTTVGDGTNYTDKDIY